MSLQHARGMNPICRPIDEVPYFKSEENEGFADKIGEALGLNQEETSLTGGKGDVGPEGAITEALDKLRNGSRADRRRAASNKSKKRHSKYITNAKKSNVKTALGAVILSKLGKIQQDTADTIKREVLKGLPLSEFAEIVGGKELPEYQKRVLDLHQARVDGTMKPELASLNTHAEHLVTPIEA